MSNQEKKYHQPNKDTTKRLALIVGGISSLFCILLIAFLFAISDEAPTQLTQEQSDEVIDLLATPIRHHVDAVDIDSSDIGIKLPKGGWVQQTDSKGKLVQQYRCELLDPNPPGLSTGWIEMKKPEVEMFLGNNKLVRITGNSGIANAPHRVLESGEIDGNVIVRMFEVDEVTNSIHPTPLMVLHTEVAKFDNFIGEITCPSEVSITSPSQTLVGRQLSIRFNDLEERIEFLHLAELEYIEILPGRSNQSLPARKVATYSTNSSAPIRTPSTRRINAATTSGDFEYYIVTLDDNVKIIQGTQGDVRLARGNTLTIAFSNKSKTSTSLRPPPNESSTPMKIPQFTHTIPVALASTAIAYSQPGLNDQPVRITCEGGLTMLPLDDPTLIPSTPTDTRIELFAFDDAPAQMIDVAESMIAKGSLIRFELQNDRSELFGHPATLLMDTMLTSSNHLWIARQDGVGGADGEGRMDSTSPENTTTSLTWSEGVDFSFNTIDGGNEGSLKEIVCNGDVELIDEGNALTCDTLTVLFEQNTDGESSPSLALATGGVKAISDTQTMWANEAEVAFTNDTKENHSDEPSMFGGSRADTMLASGDVQILLSDGGRAFCDTLDGSISQDSATLKGNVVIAYERMLMNRGEKATLTLDRTSGKGKWRGPGQALFLDELLDVSPNNRIDRPTITPPSEESKGTSLSMRANWNTGMEIDQTFNDDAGAIDLKGDVSVNSQRSQIERSQMSGDDLRLEFIEHGEKKRELKKIIARNNAQIEHRTWDTLYPDLPPVVYYIGGTHVEFDSITQEALAVGDGELVLRDPRQPVIEMHQSALAGRGTTRFTWDNKLQTTQVDGNTYRVEMTGNVEMVHKGLDGTIGMLTSDRIDAIAVDPESIKNLDGGGAQLTLRGMDLQQLNASGNVYVATETRRVDCDSFEYNLSTGFATLESKKNKSVAIVTEGAPYPVRASSIIWNMDPAIDTISIRGLQGTSTN